MAAKKQRQKCSPKKKKASPIRNTDIELVVVQQKVKAPPKKPAKKQKSPKKKVVIQNRHEEFQQLMKPKKTVDQIRLQILQGKHSKLQVVSAKQVITSSSDYQYSINNQFTEIYNKLINQPIKSDLKTITLRQQIIQMMQITIPKLKEPIPNNQITLCDLLQQTSAFSMDCRSRYHQDLLADIVDNKFKISGLEFSYNFKLLKLNKQIALQEVNVDKFRLIQGQTNELPSLNNRLLEYENDLKLHIQEGLIIQNEQKQMEQIEIFKVPRKEYEGSLMQAIAVQLPRNKNLENYQKKCTLITAARPNKRCDSFPNEQLIVQQQEQKRQPQRKLSDEYNDNDYVPDRQQQKKKGKQSVKHYQDDSAKKSLRNKKLSQNQKDVRVVSLNIKQENNYIYNQAPDKQNIQFKMKNNLDQFIDNNNINYKKNQSLNNKQQMPEKNPFQYQESNQNYPKQLNQKPKQSYHDEISKQSEQDPYRSFNSIPQYNPQNRARSLDDKQNHLIAKNQNQLNFNRISSFKQPQELYQDYQSRERKRFQAISPEEFNPGYQPQPQQQQSRITFPQPNQQKSHYYHDPYLHQPRHDIQRFHQIDDKLPVKQQYPNLAYQNQRISIPKEPQIQEQNNYVRNNKYSNKYYQTEDHDDNAEDQEDASVRLPNYNQQKSRPYQGHNNQCGTPPRKNLPIQEDRGILRQNNQPAFNIVPNQYQIPQVYENDQQSYLAQDTRYNQQNIIYGKQHSRNTLNNQGQQNQLNPSNYNNILNEISNGQKSSQFLKGLEVYSYEKNNRARNASHSLDRFDQQQGQSSGQNNRRYPENMKSSYLQSSFIMSRRDNQKNAKSLVNWVVFISELSTFQLPPVLSINNCKISTFRLDEQYFDECEYILMSDSLKLIFLRQEDVLLKEMHDILLSGNQGKALAMIGRFFNSLFQELMFKHRRVFIVIFLQYTQKYFSFLINEFISKNLFQESRIQILQYGHSDELSQLLFQKLIDFENITDQFQIPERFDKMTHILNQLDFQQLVQLKAANKIYSTLQEAYR